MQVLKRLLVGNEYNIMKRSTIWNIISSMEYSLQSVVLLIVVTRVGGLYDAGLFTIAYTFTQLVVTIGNYGMRSFQVSDVKTEYPFGTYLCSRIFSVCAMLVICIGYTLFQDYDIEKIMLFFLLCLYRMVDSLEDVFHGEMQKNMRLDIASKIVAIRIFIATLVFAIAYILTTNLIIASVGLVLVAVIVSFILNYTVIREFVTITLTITHFKLINLLRTCFPICVSDFMYNYLANAPKYAIDRNLSEEIQTIFSILFMPLFVINIMSSFVFKPMIASMGIMWSRGKKDEFVKVVIKQVGIIIVMTLGIMVVGGACGVEVLGWMYGVDLIQYRILFVLMLAFGGFAALVAFFVVVLTIIRCQRFIMIAYLISVAINLIVSNTLVIRNGIWGAGMLYGLTMGILVLMLILTFVNAIHEKKMKRIKIIN